MLQTLLLSALILTSCATSSQRQPSNIELDSSGTKINLYLKTFGEPTNPSIIFIHGGPGYNSFDFEVTTAERLSQRGFYVVVYDQAGQGRSQETESYNYKKYADDLNAIISALKLSKPILIGHSHGGPIAIKFDEFYPQLAKAIILLSAPIHFWDSMKDLYENCSGYYLRSGKSESKENLTRNFRILQAFKVGNLELVEPLANVFQHGLFGCKLYSTTKPTDDEKRLRELIGSGQPPLETLSMPGFLVNESYIYRNHLPYVEKHKNRFFAIYGKEDGLFSQTTLFNIKKAVKSQDMQHFYIIDGASHAVYIDQQQKFLDLVVNINSSLK